MQPVRNSLTAFLSLALSAGCLAETKFNGHIKYQWLAAAYPSNSLFQIDLNESSFDQFADLRFRFTGTTGSWSLNADYQFIGQYGDQVEASRKPLLSEFINGLPSDDRRFMDLDDELTDNGRVRSIHRFDRLHLSYSGERAVIRIGRQAISWGNGLIYNPLDFFNPFDPSAVDTEYKTGDDMVYGQYLFNNGDDVQAVWVGRRDPLTDDLDNELNSSAIKYHGFIGSHEFDLLYAEHFDDRIYGVGAIFNIGGAILRGDISATETDRSTTISAVTSLSYSWVSFGKNISGILEYFYNGFGETGSDYSGLNNNLELVERLARGELFNIGRQYIAGAATVELTPLVNITPTLFFNLHDSSTLLQITGQYDLYQNWQLLAAVNVPFGPDGSEFGGIDTAIDNRFLSNDWSFFAQLAWYF